MTITEFQASVKNHCNAQLVKLNIVYNFLHCFSIVSFIAALVGIPLFSYFSFIHPLIPCIDIFAIYILYYISSILFVSLESTPKGITHNVLLAKMLFEFILLVALIIYGIYNYSFRFTLLGSLAITLSTITSFAASQRDSVKKRHSLYGNIILNLTAETSEAQYLKYQQCNHFSSLDNSVKFIISGTDIRKSKEDPTCQ